MCRHRPSNANGDSDRSTARATTAPRRCHTGCATTTSAGPTARSAADPRSVVSTTSRSRTALASDARPRRLPTNSSAVVPLTGAVPARGAASKLGARRRVARSRPVPAKRGTHVRRCPTCCAVTHSRMPPNCVKSGACARRTVHTAGGRIGRRIGRIRWRGVPRSTCAPMYAECRTGSC